MSELIPLFSSRYSIGQSLLSLEEPGKVKPGEALSVFDLAKEASLTHVYLIDDVIDGLEQAYKSAAKSGTTLCFGLKVTVCADASLKDPDSIKTESKVIIMMRTTEGKASLIRLWNRATMASYYYPRLDWATLKEHWSPHLLLALPFWSSFIAKNCTTFSRIVPDMPVKPIVFREVGSELPMEPLINAALDAYISEAGIEEVVDTKSVYYRSALDFPAYQVLRCIQNRSTFDAPRVDHLASDAFSLASYLELKRAREGS